ncbi:hypothetical protein CsSME_00034152 [Camellia sinensis var. sinensis]
MHSLTVGHFLALKRILQYVKDTLSHGLYFHPSHFQLQAYSDSNWARDVIDKRSTSSYCVYLGPNLISWSSKKQTTVSHSFTEVDLVTTANPVFHSCSKHIEVDCHFVWEKVVAHKLLLKFVPTAHQLVDIFTKPPSTARFSYFTHKLMVNALPP